MHFGFQRFHNACIRKLLKETKAVDDFLETISDFIRFPYNVTDNETGSEKAGTRAVRYLVFVRHGIYQTGDDDEGDLGLTDLGRKQAKETGIRLRALGFTFTRMLNSAMPRAKETADIIFKELSQPTLARVEDASLNEGPPFPVEPPHRDWKPRMQEFEEGYKRIETAFRRYFHRAAPMQKNDSYELYVCHANVIRYFVCRALQFPPEGWLRLSMPHCSITVIAIRPNGRVNMRGFGDAGHLPREMLTYMVYDAPSQSAKSRI